MCERPIAACLRISLAGSDNALLSSGIASSSCSRTDLRRRVVKRREHRFRIPNWLRRIRHTFGRRYQLLAPRTYTDRNLAMCYLTRWIHLERSPTVARACSLIVFWVTPPREVEPAAKQFFTKLLRPTNVFGLSNCQALSYAACGN